MTSTASPDPVTDDVPFLDLADPDFDFNSPEVASAQAKSWYAESPVGPVVLRYAEGQELLRDPRLGHGGTRLIEMQGITEGPIYDWYVSMIVTFDGEEHRRLRSLVTKAFTVRMINDLRPFIRAKAERLTDHIESVDVCEFVDDFGNPLPLAAMCQLLGVPGEDYDTFKNWTMDLGLVLSFAHGGDTQARVEAAVVGLYEYVGALMDRKSVEPGDDLISALLAAQRDEGRVSRDEVLNLIVTLMFAAHDATRHQLANAMVTFSRHPEQWRLLGQRPELAAQAVEEVMRWSPSARTVLRWAEEDFDYHGLHIAKGATVVVLTPATHRDPRVYENPGTFDITVARQTPPLQFGGGPHTCLGAALARAELGEALLVLARRLGPPSVAGPVTWRPPIGIYGPEVLPLRFG
ncbi:cytochrome P450 [Micromonospora sp. NPDC050187]|uniref:cytochrome P450 n=1 Tax=Micromonospora sp. NPDC050187 TaxID=3364277 RepID=UPI003799283C